MQKYKKLWVAVAGVILIGGKELFGIEFGVTPDALYNGVVTILVAAGVYKVRNSSHEKTSTDGGRSRDSG